MINSKGYVENLYTQGCIRTYTGIYVDILNPKPEMFCIEDIAHSLSMIPRFGGHLPIFYSVAEHCIEMLKWTHLHPNAKCFDALMHDCSEAYLMDIPSPIKKLIPNYYLLEDNVMKVLSEKFKFTYPLTESIKELDKHTLEFEWNNIMIKNDHNENNRLSIERLFLRLFKSFSNV